MLKPAIDSFLAANQISLFDLRHFTDNLLLSSAQFPELHDTEWNNRK